MRIKINITYEYDVLPAYYPPNWGQGPAPSPTDIAEMDLTDSVSFGLMEIADDFQITAVEVFSDYTDAGYGCKRCGCRHAAVECESLCVPCYRKTHPLTNGA